MIKNLLKKTLLLGLTAISYLPFQSFAQTTVNYTSDSTMSDAMVGNGGVENSNFGLQNQMNVYHQLNQQIPMAFRSFIQYDLSAIPANAIITEAKLKLTTQTVDNAINHPVYVERVDTTQWTEGTITWNNQPSVHTSDQLSFTHAQTSGSGVQEFEVTDHVQKMIANPDINNGWRIRLQSESGTADFGIMYHSSEAGNTVKRPILSIEYILPIEIATTVDHCTAGNTDGTMSIALSGGSSYGIGNMFFYKTARDTAYRGSATTINNKTINNVQYNSVTGIVTADNLEPGIYIFRIIDNEYYTNSNVRFIFYKHILVGREGETTTEILMPHSAYQENISIYKDKPTYATPLDRANTNYYSSANVIPLNVIDNPNNFEAASLVKYEMDFDDQLEFSKAELQIGTWAGFFRHNNSSNATNYTLLTEDWNESAVTWNTRPVADSNYQVSVPATTVMGYDPIHNRDTVSLIPFVEYWQDHPDENHGFEIALETYGASQLAVRSYYGAGNNRNYIEFEFSVIPDVATTFSDASNTGSLIINAPPGALPYTYLINNEPLGTLIDVWNGINDSITLSLIDSIDFFTGDISATKHIFSDLPSGEYYIGVYDNNGVKVLDGSGIVNTEILFYQDTDLDLSINNIASRTPGAQGDGKGRLYSELLAYDDWGGIQFKVETLGEFTVGFNKSSDAVASTSTAIEFGIKVDAQGAYQVILNNVLLTSPGSIVAGAEINLLRDHEDYVLFINATEVHRGTVANLDGEDVSIDFLLKEIVELQISLLRDDFRKIHSGVRVAYPECGEATGSIEVRSGEIALITSISLVNNDGVSPNPTPTCTVDILGRTFCDFSSVPIGTYTLTITYDLLGGGVETTIEQIAIGYVVEWENFVGTHIKDGSLNTIQRDLVVILGDEGSWGTANSTNMTVEGYPNWVQFETEFPSMGLFVTHGSKENFVLKNLDGETAFMLHTSYFGVFKYDSSSGWLDGIDKEGVWRLEESEGALQLFENNSADDIPSGTVLADGPYEIVIGQKGDPRFVKTIASFCSNYPVADQYIEPKREIEGGYFLVPIDDILRFEFSEEYTVAGNLDYNVKNYTGVAEAGLGTMVEIYGDNRFSLDVSSLTEGFYIMEIINDKGENWFIRFKV